MMHSVGRFGMNDLRIFTFPEQFDEYRQYREAYDGDHGPGGISEAERPSVIIDAHDKILDGSGSGIYLFIKHKLGDETAYYDAKDHKIHLIESLTVPDRDIYFGDTEAFTKRLLDKRIEFLKPSETLKRC